VQRWTPDGARTGVDIPAQIGLPWGDNSGGIEPGGSGRAMRTAGEKAHANYPRLFCVKKIQEPQ